MGGSNWLITGGCGFIGTRLVHHLRRREGAAIRVLDNLSVGTPEDLAAVSAVERAQAGTSFPPAGGAAQLIVGDIRNLDDVRAAARGADVIVHLAANTGVMPSIEAPLDDCHSNVIGTLNVLEGARLEGCTRVIFASSGAPLGEQEPPIHEQKLPRPVSPYGASKLAGEAYCHVYARTYDLQTVALRFGNVYGPGSRKKGSVVAKFIREALAGEPLTIYGDGAQTRDFIHVDDLVEAVFRAADSNAAGEVFQIATGAETTVNEIVDALKVALANHGHTLEVQYTEPRKGEVIRNYSDVSKAKRELGWEARHSSVADGIAGTLEWFLSEGNS